MIAGCGFQPSVLADAHQDGHVTPEDAPDAADLIPITYVQGDSNAVSGPATEIGVQFGQPQTAGNMNLVVLSWFSSTNNAASVTDTAGNAYSSLGFTSKANIAQAAFFAPHIVAAGTNKIVIDFTGTAGSPELRILEYAGLADNPLDVAATATGTSNTTDSGPVSTTNAHDLIIGANTVSQTTTAAGTGFTQRMLVSGDIVEDREVTETGSYRATAALDTSGDWNMLIAAFRGRR